MRGKRLLALGSVAVAGLSLGLAAATGTVGFSESQAVSPQTPLSPLDPLSAFARPLTADDRAARATVEISDAVEQLTGNDAAVPAAYRAGAARDDLRVLLSGLGEARRSIFAFTTAKNRVCLGLTEFTSGCYEGLPLGATVDITVGDPDVEGGGEAAIVWGLARNNVRGVQVAAGGKNYIARLANNAYFFQLPDATMPSTAITGLSVSLTDGTVQFLKVGAGGAG
jgi:hypothetical protein